MTSASVTDTGVLTYRVMTPKPYPPSAHLKNRLTLISLRSVCE